MVVAAPRKQSITLITLWQSSTGQIPSLLHMRLGIAEDPIGIARLLIGLGTVTGLEKTTMASMGTAQLLALALLQLPPLGTRRGIGTATMRLGIAEDRTTIGGIALIGAAGNTGRSAQHCGMEMLFTRILYR